MYYTYKMNRPKGTLSQQHIVKKCFYPGLFIGLAIDVVVILAVKHFWEPGQEVIYLPIFALALSFGRTFIGLRKLRNSRTKQLEYFQKLSDTRSRAYARFLEDEIKKGYSIGLIFMKMPSDYNLKNDPPVSENWNQK